jgi:hypothetical protein
VAAGLTDKSVARLSAPMIVSERAADYIRLEHAIISALNVAAGEEIRWLPRRNASALCLPGNDLWVFDDPLVRFGHFAGDGEFIDHELSDDPAVMWLCTTAFAAVWERPSTTPATGLPDVGRAQHGRTRTRRARNLRFGQVLDRK